jgi:hypothetical protein
VRRIFWTIFGFGLCGLLLAARAETYQLTDGTALTGDIVSFNDNGILFRLEDDKYSDRLPWTKFSQDALKQLGKNPKIKPFVEPFIEVLPAERAKKREPVRVRDVSRLELPPKQSLFGALFSSSVGLVVLLLIYVANIYAGFEVAIARARPIPLVMGVAAVLPVLGPVLFLTLPVRTEAAPAEPQPAAAPHTFAVPGQPPAGGGIHIVEASWQTAAPAAPTGPQTFQRGQFTFNRRFFETKFSGFFSVIRREPEKSQELIVKTGHQNMIVDRITRITANEVHFEIGQGTLKQEIMVPFAEILEVQLKPKAGQPD